MKLKHYLDKVGIGKKECVCSEETQEACGCDCGAWTWNYALTKIYPLEVCIDEEFIFDMLNNFNPYGQTYSYRLSEKEARSLAKAITSDCIVIRKGKRC